MYTKFYDNTIITKFIKSLVAQTYVPIVSTWVPGDFAIKGLLYVTRDYVVRCDHTGYPTSITDVCNGSQHGHDGTTSNYFTIVCPYVLGQNYYGVTTNYVSSINGYDSTTHYYLGQYLRAIRDLYDINLMPFYNCFCGDYISDMSFDKDSSIKSVEKGYKIISIPAKFGSTYTIAIDCDTKVSVESVIYGNKGIIKNKTDILNTTKSSYKEVSRSSFTNPFTYNTPSWEQLTSSDSSTQNDESITTLGQYEKFLKVLVKVPVNCNSSIVVLEGDYRTIPKSDTSKDIRVVNGVGEHTINSKNVDGTVIRVYGEGTSNGVNLRQSPLGLLQMSDGNTYAFSDRLVEYLLLGVITSEDAITDNIKRIQQYASSVENKIKNNYAININDDGIWSDDLRRYMYDLVTVEHGIGTASLIRKLDINGYVDKDSEKIITRGQHV